MTAYKSFEILSSRPVYENAWIRLTEHQVTTPGGNPGVYGIVHFKNHAVGVIPYDDEGHLWLVGQHRLPLDLFSWEIPEGGAPAGEALEDCARRELREETGLSADRYVRILDLHLSNSVTDERATVFLARGLTLGEAFPEDTEALSVERVSLDDALARIDVGLITDAITVAALLKLEQMRRKGEL